MMTGHFNYSHESPTSRYRDIPARKELHAPYRDVIASAADSWYDWILAAAAGP